MKNAKSSFVMLGVSMTRITLDFRCLFKDLSLVFRNIRLLNTCKRRYYINKTKMTKVTTRLRKAQGLWESLPDNARRDHTLNTVLKKIKFYKTLTKDV